MAGAGVLLLCFLRLIVVWIEVGHMARAVLDAVCEVSTSTVIWILPRLQRSPARRMTSLATRSWSGSGSAFRGLQTQAR
jgi:hypothetical protein